MHMAMSEDDPTTLTFSGPKVERLPALPREEAQRARRAVRAMADLQAIPMMRNLIDLANNAEDEKLRRLCILDVLALSVRTKSNEELDPESPVVDGTTSEAKETALAALEEATATEEDPGSE